MLLSAIVFAAAFSVSQLLTVLKLISRASHTVLPPGPGDPVLPPYPCDLQGTLRKQ